jgi:hypothetical protein
LACWRALVFILRRRTNARLAYAKAKSCSLFQGHAEELNEALRITPDMRNVERELITAASPQPFDCNHDK